MPRRWSAWLLGALVLLGACASVDDASEGAAISTLVPTSSAPAPSSTSTITAEDGCAHVIAATIERGPSGFTVAATVRSADTGWDKYADAWEVRTEGGTVLGERILAHPHETEQPFTRSLSGVEIPEDISQVVIAARDSVAGFCGAEVILQVPPS